MAACWVICIVSCLVLSGVSPANAQIIPVTCPPICAPPPPPTPTPTPTPTPSDTTDHGGHGWKAGADIGKAAAIGVGTASTALVIRGAFVSATEHREMMFGEAWCTAENFGIPALKLFRVIGGLIHNDPVPIGDVVFCPEERLNKKYSPALYAKVHGHKLARHHRAAKHRTAHLKHKKHRRVA